MGGIPAGPSEYTRVLSGPLTPPPQPAAPMPPPAPAAPPPPPPRSRTAFIIGLVVVIVATLALVLVFALRGGDAEPGTTEASPEVPAADTAR